MEHIIIRINKYNFCKNSVSVQCMSDYRYLENYTNLTDEELEITLKSLTKKYPNAHTCKFEY